MNSAITSQHWDEVFRTKAEDKASWFEAIPKASIRLIESAQLPKTAPIIDVGAGMSRLASELIARGYVDVTVLDISAEAVGRLIARTGRSTAIKAIVADVTTWRPDRRYQLWHDRAVLHCLVSDTDRSAYRTTLLEALSPNGHVIIIAFGRLAPDRCSGLPVRRYDRDDLVSFLGDDFRLLEAGGLDHNGLDPAVCRCAFRPQKIRKRCMRLRGQELPFGCKRSSYLAVSGRPSLGNALSRCARGLLRAGARSLCASSTS